MRIASPELSTPGLPIRQDVFVLGPTTIQYLRVTTSDARLPALLAARRRLLALVAFEPLHGRTKIWGLPGTWSLRPDRAPGARVELSAGETLTIDGRTVRGTVDLDPAGMMSAPSATLGAGLGVVVFPDPADNVTWVGIADPASPRVAAFRDIISYPPDERWRISVVFEPADVNESTSRVERSRPSDDQTYTMPRLGWFTTTIDGEQYRLEVSSRGPDMPYLSFRDATSGVSSYGAGRFVSVPGLPAETWEIDLNTAFLPPCALNPLISCPLPAPGNLIRAEVHAGERSVVFEPEQP